MKIRLEGTALELPPGLMRPWPCEPKFWKNDLPANLFLLRVVPQCVIKLHRLFHTSNRNTHLSCFSKIKACMGVKYFLVCVRKHKSNLSTNIRTTVGKKTQWSVEKCEFLTETTFSPDFYDSVVCFLLPKCVFFYQWCLSFFSSQQYVSMIFVKQCW